MVSATDNEMNPDEPDRKPSQNPKAAIYFILVILVAVPWIIYWQYGFTAGMGGVLLSQVMYVAISNPRGLGLGIPWIIIALNSLVLVAVALIVLFVAWIG